MAERDYYEVLGVSRSATPDQIKSAYRKLAKKFHPDRNPDDKTAESRFKEVQAAYEVLSDAQQRQRYDTFGYTGPRSGEGPQGWRSGPAHEHVYTWRNGGGPDIPVENLEDLFQVFAGQGGFGGLGGGGRGGGAADGIFEQFFGGRRGRGGRSGRGGRDRTSEAAEGYQNAGQDIEHPVSLTFEQAVHGTALDLQLTPAGGGVAEAVRVKIPPGVAEGQRVRVRGKGGPSVPGRPSGDLYIVCHIRPHAFFRRMGHDIYLELPLTISEAVLGTKVEIPTLEGKSVLTVPPGTPSGSKLRLKGQGVKPPGDKPPGDLFAVVRIVPPKSLTPRQRELYEQLRMVGEDLPRQGLGW
ncbi:MAG: J domain-containing protein [Phycisphaerae bacterium]|nr:J domain-containing protein [Phycisphaerae bacterium]